MVNGTPMQKLPVKTVPSKNNNFLTFNLSNNNSVFVTKCNITTTN